MGDQFEILFNKLVGAVSGDDDNYLSQALNEMISYLNSIINKNKLFKIKKISNSNIKIYGDDTFMYALHDTINYSVEVIRNTQSKIKSKQDLKYDDVTYSMYLVDAIAHELCHCNQREENKNGFISEQNYLNSLCCALVYFKNINYLDRATEGEAYKTGANTIKYLVANLKNYEYKEIYEKQMSEWTFFRKNLLYHEAIGDLDNIPFMEHKHKNGISEFFDIIRYANHNLSIAEKMLPQYNSLKLDEKMRNVMIKDFPLLTIGLEEENKKWRKKNAYELMEQYFGNYIKYSNNKFNIDLKEKLALSDIYIYLLLPLLTEEVYNNLCQIYGNRKIDNFMQHLQDRIMIKITLYEQSYIESIYKIQKVRKVDKNILHNVDEAYAKKKYNTSISCLKDYMKKIDNCLGGNRKFSK